MIVFCKFLIGPILCFTIVQCNGMFKLCSNFLKSNRIDAMYLTCKGEIWGIFCFCLLLFLTWNFSLMNNVMVIGHPWALRHLFLAHCLNDIPCLSHTICSIIFYPMFRADSRFWLANNIEEYTSISRLTSSAWTMMRKEHHWWHHNGDHEGHPLSLLLWCD